MADSAPQHEPWAIRLPGDEAVRKPGQNLQEWADDDRGRARRLFDRVTFRELKDPKLAGAWGEERVGRELAKLDAAWTVVHGVRVGQRADVDHLVVGPAGVFCMNTKNVDFDAKVHVSARRFRVNGYSRDYYPKAVKEAARVAERLAAVVGHPVEVRPVLVITGVDLKNLRIREQPADVRVVARRELCWWLTAQSRRLDDGTVQRLAHAARRPSTWDPTKVAEVLDVQPEPPSPPLVAPVEQKSASGEQPELASITVNRWRRYGHDRLYVNDTRTDARLGWRDEKTGDIHVEGGADAAIIDAALRAWDADLD